MHGRASAVFSCGGTMSVKRCEIYSDQGCVNLCWRASAMIPAVRLAVVSPDQQNRILICAPGPCRCHQSRNQLRQRTQPRVEELSHVLRKSASPYTKVIPQGWLATYWMGMATGLPCRRRQYLDTLGLRHTLTKCIHVLRRHMDTLSLRNLWS